MGKNPEGFAQEFEAFNIPGSSFQQPQGQTPPPPGPQRLPEDLRVKRDRGAAPSQGLGGFCKEGPQ
ncbi:hypothetical protein RHGRI_011548 [Rhododendron griersonianum]|uniref:Uncharacterized protein n=1 Tax=Rhododendron griersonianum TaxID=479676 RepID=A0AAV6KMA0_9ERIC|nr:hypothetical protein RHGRI_011548 [Rhododendron griersonianum]